ncbi:MAG: N-acetyl-gamma-glutamyl-phosphate reductase, partial [Kiritimatiellae bacterium]|nr:N-acetyl-gamma-glutamyl-phosphate reductase [Kiritimatiellia bacterium]
RKGTIKFVDDSQDGGFLSSAALSGRDDMEISVYGNKDRLMLVALFDNLGKGACGAAIENMNIALGLDPCLGLKLGGGAQC